VLRLKFPYEQILPPWDVIGEISTTIKPSSWLLIGGLMVQAHAMIAGTESRPTTDVDMLIDVLSDSENIKHVIGGLERLGFSMQEPGLRGTSLHRLRRDEQIVDVLIAEHLPSRKQKGARIGRFPANSQ